MKTPKLKSYADAIIRLAELHVDPRDAETIMKDLVKGRVVLWNDNDTDPEGSVVWSSMRPNNSWRKALFYLGLQ